MTDPKFLHRSYKRWITIFVFLVVATSPMAYSGSEGRPSAEANFQRGKTLGGSGDGKLILLGTAGGPVIQDARSGPASLLIVNGERYLVDVGYGTVHQLDKLGLKANDIGHIFLTHLHFDHDADLSALIGFNWSGGDRKPVAVMGPPGTEKFVASAVAHLKITEYLYGLLLPPGLTIKGLVTARDVDTQSPKLIYEDENLRVIAVENSHYSAVPPVGQDYGQPRSYSYRFETANRVIVFTGDTGPSDAVTELARGADILVAEVIDPEAVIDSIRKISGASEEALAKVARHQHKQHLSAEELGKMAKRAKVKKVILTHISSSGNIEATAEKVRLSYDGPIAPGSDLLSLDL